MTEGTTSCHVSTDVSFLCGERRGRLNDVLVPTAVGLIGFTMTKEVTIPTDGWFASDVAGAVT